MSGSSQRTVLAKTVAAFRNGLPPNELEAFNECLVHIYLDPDGKKTGRSVERVKPPHVYFFHAHEDGLFWLSYHVTRTTGNPGHAMIEVFAADYL